MSKSTTTTVHHILTYSYLVYFVLVLISIITSSIFEIYDNYSYAWGLTFLVWGTALVFWAQKTSRKTYHSQKGDKTHQYFLCGPYRISRTPTHLGLLVLVVGLGMMMGYPVVIISGFISYLITRYTFVHFQEKHLTEQFGEEYKKYKANVLT